MTIASPPAPSPLGWRGEMRNGIFLWVRRGDKPYWRRRKRFWRRRKPKGRGRKAFCRRRKWNKRGLKRYRWRRKPFWRGRKPKERWRKGYGRRRKLKGRGRKRYWRRRKPRGRRRKWGFFVKMGGFNRDGGKLVDWWVKWVSYDCCRNSFMSLASVGVSEVSCTKLNSW